MASHPQLQGAGKLVLDRGPHQTKPTLDGPLGGVSIKGQQVAGGLGGAAGGLGGGLGGAPGGLAPANGTTGPGVFDTSAPAGGPWVWAPWGMARPARHRGVALSARRA